MNKQKIIILAAAAVGIVGILLPWASVSLGFLGSYSQNGFNSGWTGYATLASILAAGGILFKDSDRNAPITADMKKIVAGAGGGAVLFSLLFMIIIKSSKGGGLIDLGLGVFLCIIAGIALLVIPFAIKGDGSFEMPSKDSIKADLEAKDDNSSSADGSDTIE